MQLDTSLRTDSIGQILIRNNKLTDQQAIEIINRQKDLNKRFGDIAIELGYVTAQDIENVLLSQFDLSYTNSDVDLINQSFYTLQDPYSEKSESIRVLREEINQYRQKKSLSLFFASSEFDGNTEVLLANVAISFAQSGIRTLLVDMNLRNSSLHQLFNIDNKYGTADILAERTNLECIHSLRFVRGLDFISCGTSVPNPSELLSKLSFDDFMVAMQSRYEIILINSPAINDFADAQIIADKSKNGIFVVTKNHTKEKEIDISMSKLTPTGVQIIGAVYVE